MNIERSQLQAAVGRGLISEAQAAQVWALLEEQSKDRPAFTFTHVLYYLGGLIAIGGMSVYVTLGWERLSGAEIFFIAAAYALVGLVFTHYLLEKMQLAIPAGLTGAFVVALTPLAVYGLQRWFGWWDVRQPYRAYHTLIDSRWIAMELATLAVGAAMLWRYRLPFLIMPVAGTLWYMSMDLAPLLHGYLYGADPTAAGWAGAQALWRLRQLVSVGFGLVVILVAVLVDIRSDGRRDFAFWLYLAGVAAFWGGLSSMESGSEVGKIVYCAINVAMVFTGAVLSRRVFAVFGALGVALYLGHLASRVFANSLLFPIVLTFIGLGVIALGVLWQRSEQEISRRVRRHLPAPLRQLVERQAA
jgi:hypothetical protein